MQSSQSVLVREIHTILWCTLHPAQLAVSRRERIRQIDCVYLCEIRRLCIHIRCTGGGHGVPRHWRCMRSVLQGGVTSVKVDLAAAAVGTTSCTGGCNFAGRVLLQVPRQRKLPCNTRPRVQHTQASVRCAGVRQWLKIVTACTVHGRHFT